MPEPAAEPSPAPLPRAPAPPPVPPAEPVVLPPRRVARPERTVSSLVHEIAHAADREAKVLELRDAEIALRGKANKSRATARAGLQISVGGGAVIILQNLPVFLSGIAGSLVPALGIALGAVVLGGLILSWNKSRSAEDLELEAERIRTAIAETPPERET